MVFIATFAREGIKGKKVLVKTVLAQELVPHKPEYEFKEKNSHDEAYRDAWFANYRTQIDRKIVVPIMEKLERELNAGLTAEEAEAAFPRVGQHSRKVFYVHLLNNKRIMF